MKFGIRGGIWQGAEMTIRRLAGTMSAAGAIKRVRYTHDAMIDLMIARPEISQGELARHFGYEMNWVSRVLNSDAFLERLALRKSDLVDPTVVASIDEKFRVLASVSLDRVIDHVERSGDVKSAFRGMEIAARAMGMGVREKNVSMQANFVVRLPEKSADSASWEAEVRGTNLIGS